VVELVELERALVAAKRRLYAETKVGLVKDGLCGREQWRQCTLVVTQLGWRVVSMAPPVRRRGVGVVAVSVRLQASARQRCPARVPPVRPATVQVCPPRCLACQQGQRLGVLHKINVYYSVEA
jgi:hypothetical protein